MSKNNRNNYSEALRDAGLDPSADAVLLRKLGFDQNGTYTGGSSEVEVADNGTSRARGLYARVYDKAPRPQKPLYERIRHQQNRSKRLRTTVGVVAATMVATATAGLVYKVWPDVMDGHKQAENPPVASEPYVLPDPWEDLAPLSEAPHYDPDDVCGHGRSTASLESDQVENAAGEHGKEAQQEAVKDIVDTLHDVNPVLSDSHKAVLGTGIGHDTEANKQRAFDRVQKIADAVGKELDLTVDTNNLEVYPGAPDMGEVWLTPPSSCEVLKSLR